MHRGGRAGGWLCHVGSVQLDDICPVYCTALYCTIATPAATIMIRVSAVNRPALPENREALYTLHWPTETGTDIETGMNTLANASQMAMPNMGSCTSHLICPSPCTSAWQTP